MRDTDLRGEPTSWLVIFHTSTGRRWIDRLIPGHFKHVSAACWIDDPGVWLFYEAGLRGKSLKVLPVAAGDRHYAVTARGAAVLRVPVDRRRQVPIFGWCVPAIRQLTGVRCFAVTPSALYRAMVRSNATEIVAHESRQPASPGAYAGRT